MKKLLRYVALLPDNNLLDYSFNPGVASLHGSDVVQQNGGGLNPLDPLFPGTEAHFNYGYSSNATNPATPINISGNSNNTTSPPIYQNTQAGGAAASGHVLSVSWALTASSGESADKPHTQPLAELPADANPAPVPHIPGTVLRITEDAPAKRIHGISVSDAGSNGDITVRLSVDHGTLGVSTTLSSRLTDAGITGLTDAGIQGQGSGTLTLTGSANAINATLTTLTYTVAPDYNGSDTLTVSSSYGNTPAQSSSGTMAIDVAVVNDAPTLAGIPASAQSIITNQAATLADFRVDDADAANPALNPTLFVTLTPTGGSIGGFTEGGVNGLLIHLGGNTVQLTGTAALINTALAAATFTASATGAASIAVSVSNKALGDSTPATSGTYNFMAYAAPTLNLPNGRNSFVNASQDTLDVEVAFANLLAGDTVQLKLGTDNTDNTNNLGSVHTITPSEAQANKLSLTVNKADLGADGSKTLTALITQGNISQAAHTSALNLTLDTAAPTLAITSSVSAVKAGETAPITFTFSEEPTGFDSSVIVVTGGTLGTLSGTGTTRTATFTPTPGIDSTTASISVEGGENSYTDAAGNFGSAGTTPMLSVDTKAPTLAITSS
ncbi:MAG: Ig-like domain-containing protein, partial [Rhodoferax sp.]|nr:Ig-like domain-containing protein [Rhodoferax sp.]